MSCYKCVRWTRPGKKYCPNCRQRALVNTPDKTVLFICAPRTPEEEERMNKSIARYRDIKPVFVYSSSAHDMEPVSRRIATSFGTTAKVKVLLDESYGASTVSIGLLIPNENRVGLYIFLTYETHTKRAHSEYYKKFNSVSRPDPIEVVRGDVLLIDFTARHVRKI